MAVDMLRFDARDGGYAPVYLELDVEHFDAFLDAVPGPAVLVLRTRDLRSLFKTESVRLRVSPLRTQGGDKGLSVYFHGARPVALESKYQQRGRLLSSIRNFIEGARGRGEPTVHFLGVSPELFDELLQGAIAGDAERDKTSRLASTGGGDEPHAPSPPISPEDEWLAPFSGTSPELEKVRTLIRRAATAPEFTDTPVLISGPSGSGKELAARAVHEIGLGARGGLWVPLNCAAIPKELLESELFGIEAKVVGDVAARIGLWEQASIGRGTLFLDEIGDLREEHQAKILRALEEGEVRRIGGRNEVRVNARIIAATNRDLHGMVLEGRFRADLYYRLARIMIDVPGLAQRGDLERLAQQIWRDEVTRSQKARLSPEIIQLLDSHTWPGGVRELKAVLETLYIHHYGELTPRVEQLIEALQTRPDSPLPAWVASGTAPPGESATRLAAAGAPVPGSLATIGVHVEAFRRRRPLYERFANVLRTILTELAERHAPLAIVQARAKPVASFAEKVLREQGKLSDPLEDIHDLCAARIIVHTEDQIREVRGFLEQYFEVDAKESLAPERPTAPAIPGYDAVRFYVRLDRVRAQALATALGIEVPSDVLGHWAEVEVQTSLEHAWDHVNREMGHEVRLPMPSRWREELGGVAEVLKAVDRSFARIRKGFAATYRTTYPAYLTPERIASEIELLGSVLACENDPRVAARLGKFAISIGDWGRAIDTLEPHAAAGYQPALRDLGVALCQKHRGSPESAVYVRGQNLLEQACAEPHRDPDALASLAGTWKRRGRHDKAREYCGRALELDPGDPYALGGLLEAELVLHPEADSVTALLPSIERAVERCRDHVDAGVNLPWALYDLGKFLLLLGKTTEGLIASARGMELSTASFMIQTSLESLDRLAHSRGAWPGLADARAILALGCAARFPTDTAQRQMEKLLPTPTRITPPVVFVLESPDESTAEISRGRTAIDEAVRDYRGTIVSGDWLQGWADVVGSRIRPSEVLVLAVGSGEETDLGSRVGSALGARVVHVSDASAPPRSAGDTSDAVSVVPPDAGVIRNLLEPGEASSGTERLPDPTT